MSHPQPTPQDDDENWLPSRDHLCWQEADECGCRCIRPKDHEPDSLTCSTHGNRLSCSTPVKPSPTEDHLIESIARWLGERESTHLWPEIHESDKACYRDAARDLITKTKFGLVAAAVSLNPEERKIAADALEAMGPGASAAAEAGMKVANRHIQFAGQEAGKAFLGIIQGFAEEPPPPTGALTFPDNVVAVQLPEPDEGNDGRYLATWNLSGQETVQVDVFGHALYEGNEYSVPEARAMAAALLAAAAKIEAGE